MRAKLELKVRCLEPEPLENIGVPVLATTGVDPDDEFVDLVEQLTGEIPAAREVDPGTVLLLEPADRGSGVGADEGDRRGRGSP